MMRFIGEAYGMMASLIPSMPWSSTSGGQFCYQTAYVYSLNIGGGKQGALPTSMLEPEGWELNS
jgi:hypothetical protein